MSVYDVGVRTSQIRNIIIIRVLPSWNFLIQRNKQEVSKVILHCNVKKVKKWKDDVDKIYQSPAPETLTTEAGACPGTEAG